MNNTRFFAGLSAFFFLVSSFVNAANTTLVAHEEGEPTKRGLSGNAIASSVALPDDECLTFFALVPTVLRGKAYQTATTAQGKDRPESQEALSGQRQSDTRHAREYPMKTAI
jgi:hypothetical protein